MAKKRLGDRRDATLVRDADSMHTIMGYIYPNRADNEAYISETIDLTAINQFLAEKNADKPEFKYTMFHVIVAALLKTVTLRPLLNRFYANEYLYMRNELSAAFTIKRKFADDGAEGLVRLVSSPDHTFRDVYEFLKAKITAERSPKSDNANTTEDSMDMFNKMPRFLSKFLVHRVRFLDRHGWLPASFADSDPGQASIFLTNLGSIKLRCGYHHLANWGTNSLFVVIGEKRIAPAFNPDGTYVMKEFLDLGLTVDERIADGYYYSKSVRLMKYLLEHPTELEKPFKEAVDYE